MNWKKTENGYQGTLTFENQTELAEFVLELAQLSDTRQHHADMEIRHNKLHLTVFTHDQQKITEKDEALCREIERRYSNT